LLSFGLYSQESANYKEINKLIKQKKQDQAITQILEMLEKHPESFNQAADSLKMAMKNQAKFIEALLYMTQQLYKNPNNTSRVLKLIANIESLNMDMDPNIDKFLQRLKVSAIYIANKIRFNAIMDEGIALIKKERFVEASSCFAQGYSICLDDYRQEYAETEQLEDTEEVIKEIKKAIPLLKRQDIKFIEAINAYKAMLKKNVLDINEEVVAKLEEEASSMHSIGKIVFDGGEFLNAYLMEAQAKENFDESSFLPYSTRITLGRLNAQYYEGVEGAMNAALFVRLSALQDSIIRFLKNSTMDMFGKFKFGYLFDSDTLDPIDAHIKEYRRIVTLIEGLNVDGVKYPLSQVESKERMTNILVLKNIITDTFDVYKQYFEIKQHVYKGSNYANKAAQNDIIMLSTLYGGIAPIQEELEKYSYEVMKEEKEELSKVHAKMFEAIADLFQDRLERYAEFKDNGGKDFCKEHENKFLLAKQMIEGSKKEGSDESDAAQKNPTKALEELEEQKPKIDADIAILQQAVAFISATDKKVKLPLSVKRYMDNIKVSEQKLLGMSKEIATLTGNARKHLFDMKLAKQEADFRYNEAVRNLKNQDFSTARANIAHSQRKSNEALAVETNEEYRALVDDRLSKLGEEINKRENEIVVKEVRISLDKAKKFYFNGNFGDAERTLLSANTMWHTTNVEENEEIQSWLNIARTANIMKTGRSIPQSASLYPHMSQLLNTSRQLYDEASKIIKKDRDVALKKLDDARNNIKQVLLVYPLNEEAGQLSLRIDQLTDPQNFATQVSRKIETIRREYRRNPQTHYAELLNLYTMDRNFPGIAKLKDEVEIYLGIKILPPDTSAVDLSLALTNEADAVFRANNRAAYGEALQKLNQAIKLNPNNDRAFLLKDRIQTAIGGSAITVLSSANEERYRQAVLALRRGNKITAISLVEQLLRDPEGRKSAKVHDLKKRINAQL